jgi:tellurite resistance protein TerC
MGQSLFGHGYRAVRRVVIAVIGGTVVLVGVAMLVLPGPAFVVIPAGLAILALEFAWARRWLKEARAQAAALVQRAQGSKPASPER